MKYLDEYRDPVLAKKLIAEIHRITTRPWTLMEVCGGQTHTIVKQGIDEALPEGVRMIHGPGCPVCVTPLEQVDKALAIAARPDVIFTSYGDMLRVPGSSTDLLALKARGADVRIVYSPLDALKIAIANPDRQVVFFAVGFETTAPANAMAVAEAARRGIDNFSVLVSHVLVPPAMIALLDSPNNQVQGFLAAGHVCAVMGWTEYEPIAARYRVPIVVTGFEPLDLLEGILMAIRQLEEGRAEVENQYVRAVKREGVPLAQRQIFEVFEVGERKWRGVGAIPESGYRLRAGVRAIRRRAEVRRRRDPHERTPGLHRGGDPDGREAAPGLHGLRDALHAPEAAGRPDGQLGGDVRRLLLGGPRPGRGTVTPAGHPAAAGCPHRRGRRGGGIAMSIRHDPLVANDGSPAPTIEPEGVVCPAPIAEGERVILGHGSGGQLSAALLRDVIGPALARRIAGRTAQRRRHRGGGRDARCVHHRLVRREPDSASRAATSASWPSTGPSTTSR